MINTITIYRRLFASLLAMWMSLIVVSGIVFMHKEVTSDGEIITHIHPYDFTKKKNKPQHKSDAEIGYLDVIFQGTFTEPTFEWPSPPIRLEYEVINFFNYFESYISTDHTHCLNRGPPVVG